MAGPVPAFVSHSRSLAGAAQGGCYSIIYVLLQEFLFQYIGMSLLILGATAIVVILVSPKGIWGNRPRKAGRGIVLVAAKIDP